MRNMPYMAMLFVQCVYAVMALLSKAAMSQGMNPFVFVVYRLSLAFLALSPLALFFERKGSVPLTFSMLCKIFMVSFCGLTLSLNLYCIAIKYTSATFAAATTNLIPTITFIIALLLRLESVRHVGGAAKVIGSMVGVSGALVYAFVKGPSLNLAKDRGNYNDSFASHSQQWIKGSLFMISANILWSLWLIMQGWLIKQYPAKLRLTALQCLFGSIQSASWAIAMEKKPSAWILHWDIRLLAVAYCGVMVTGVTYCIQVWAIEKKGPVFTAIFTPLALLITAVSSTILWKESLYWGSVGGGILMVAGLYLVLWGKTKEEDVPLPTTKANVPLPTTKAKMMEGNLVISINACKDGVDQI